MNYGERHVSFSNSMNSVAFLKVSKPKDNKDFKLPDIVPSIIENDYSNTIKYNKKLSNYDSLSIDIKHNKFQNGKLVNATRQNSNKDKEIVKEQHNLKKLIKSPTVNYEDYSPSKTANKARFDEYSPLPKKICKPEVSKTMNEGIPSISKRENKQSIIYNSNEKKTSIKSVNNFFESKDNIAYKIDMTTSILDPKYNNNNSNTNTNKNKNPILGKEPACNLIRVRHKPRLELKKSPILIFFFEGTIGSIQRQSFWNSYFVLNLRKDSVASLLELRIYFQIILVVRSLKTDYELLKKECNSLIKCFDSIYLTSYEDNICFCQIFQDFNDIGPLDIKKFIVIGSMPLEYDDIWDVNDEPIISEEILYKKYFAECKNIPYLHGEKDYCELPITILLPDLRMNAKSISMKTFADIIFSLLCMSIDEKINEKKRADEEKMSNEIKYLTAKEMAEAKPFTKYVASLEPIPPLNTVLKCYSGRFNQNVNFLEHMTWEFVFNTSRKKNILPLLHIRTNQVQKYLIEMKNLRHYIVHNLNMFKKTIMNSFERLNSSYLDSFTSFEAINFINRIQSLNEDTLAYIKKRSQKYYCEIEVELEKINNLDISKIDQRFIIIPIKKYFTFLPETKNLKLVHPSILNLIHN